MYANADCTIFYPLYDKTLREDTWHRAQIKGVFWENCKAASVSTRGLAEADSVTVYIPFSADFAGKVYKSPKELKQTSEGTFTLAVGGKIVKGLVEYDESISKLSEHFDDVFTITSVDTMDYGSTDMRHWQIGGQ